MTNKVLLIRLAVLLILSTPSFAQEPITVLLARTSGVSDADAREMLDQINDLAENSDIAGLGGFVSASMSGGFPNVHFVSCPSTSGPAIINCARTNLSTLRNDKAADIVLLMVSQDIANDCGSVDPGMINLPLVSTSNETFGYAVVEKACFLTQFNGQVPASHEVGHLLYIEHVDNDASESLPLLAGPTNHAMEDIVNNATAVASVGDCFPGCNWHNFLSDKNKEFSGVLGGSAGNSSESHAVGVVQSISWDTVAAYRPMPGPSIASCPVQFVTCNGNSMMTAITPYLNEPYQITSLEYATRQSTNQSWLPGYEGSFTCPTHGASSSFWARIIVNTLYGSTECEQFVYINPWNPCDNDPW